MNKNNSGAQKYDNKEEKRNDYRGLIVELGFDAAKELYNRIKNNSGDYKSIDEDDNLSSVDKAIAKRKIFIFDSSLVVLLLGGLIIAAKQIDKK